jgi:hypothetical protein
VIAVFVLAALGPGPSSAQDSRPTDVARRLHEIVDQKIEALRAELHREIDNALRDDSEAFRSMTPSELRQLAPEIPSGLKLAPEPASAEFHELHRLLPPGTARRIDAVVPGSQAERLGFLVGDFFLGAWLRGANPSARVIRRNVLLDPTREPTETAGQMVDRMWDEALRNAMKSGFEAVRTDQPGPDSRPVRK